MGGCSAIVTDQRQSCRRDPAPWLTSFQPIALSHALQNDETGALVASSGDREDGRRGDQPGGAQLRVAGDRMQRRRRLCRRRQRAHLRQPQDARFARGGHHPAARRSGPGRRFHRRGARARRAGARQARSGPRRDRGHDPGLLRPHRSRRPAGRPHGRLRRGDGRVQKRLGRDRDDRQQDQHARPQRHDRGGARRRGGALASRSSPPR